MNIFLSYDPRILKKSSDGCLLKVNLNKNKVVFFFFTKQCVMEAQYYLNYRHCFFQGCQLGTLPSYKHLGLTFSNDLKWSLQAYNNIENVADCTSII